MFQNEVVVTFTLGRSEYILMPDRKKLRDGPSSLQLTWFSNGGACDSQPASPYSVVPMDVRGPITGEINRLTSMD